jgi:hypothetical protein
LNRSYILPGLLLYPSRQVLYPSEADRVCFQTRLNSSKVLYVLLSCHLLISLPLVSSFLLCLVLLY